LVPLKGGRMRRRRTGGTQPVALPSRPPGKNAPGPAGGNTPQAVQATGGLSAIPATPDLPSEEVSLNRLTSPANKVRGIRPAAGPLGYETHLPVGGAGCVRLRRRWAPGTTHRGRIDNPPLPFGLRLYCAWCERE
jgi:hypothetical protein